MNMIRPGSAPGCRVDGLFQLFRLFWNYLSWLFDWVFYQVLFLGLNSFAVLLVIWVNYYSKVGDSYGNRTRSRPATLVVPTKPDAIRPFENTWCSTIVDS